MKPPLARWMACTALAGLIVFSVSCRQQSALPPEAVATVGDAVITVDALQQALARRGWHNPTAEQKAAVLEDLIRFEALHAQARKTGYLQQPEVQNAIKHLVAARYREKLATNQSALPETAAAGLQTYYQAHRDAFRVPEQVQVALVFLPLSSKAVPEKRREAEQRAHELRHLAETECASLAHFGPVAQTHSAHQASRYRGGELGGLTRQQAAGSFSPEVVEAMFALRQPGELSPVVSASDGFYLLKLVGRRPASVRPLAEVKAAVAFQWQRERAGQREAALFARLKAGLPIRVNEVVLARVKPARPPQPSAPPALSSR